MLLDRWQDILINFVSAYCNSAGLLRINTSKISLNSEVLDISYLGAEKIKVCLHVDETSSDMTGIETMTTDGDAVDITPRIF